MTVKHCQIGKIYNALKNISSQRIPAEKAYKIFRLKKDLRELLEFAVAEEEKLFDKYKVKVKNGNIEADDIGVIENLNGELKELCKEREITHEKITSPDLACKYACVRYACVHAGSLPAFDRSSG